MTKANQQLYNGCLTVVVSVVLWMVHLASRLALGELSNFTELNQNNIYLTMWFVY